MVELEAEKKEVDTGMPTLGYGPMLCSGTRIWMRVHPSIMFNAIAEYFLIADNLSTPFETPKHNQNGPLVKGREKLAGKTRRQITDYKSMMQKANAT
jgi:hypothetical protein